MKGNPGVARRGLGFEMLEERIAPSALSLRANLQPHQPSAKVAYTFVANLAPANSTDPAKGVVKIHFARDLREANISGSLANISNVSAIVLHLPTVSSTSPPSNTTVMSTTVTPPIVTTTTTNVTTSTSKNVQTIAVLLKPGSGSGPFRHVAFDVPLNRFGLIGQLVGKPLSSLFDDVTNHQLSVVVLTNNGVDPATTVAPGNMQSGEIQGVFEPVTQR